MTLTLLCFQIAAAGRDFPRSLNLLRERHVAMCDNVSVLDRYIKFTAGISIRYHVVRFLYEVPVGVSFRWDIVNPSPEVHRSNLYQVGHG